MIINENDGWILTSPSKCGTESVMSMVKKLGVDGLYYSMPKHARVVPDAYSEYRPYMLVRNPYDRMWSAYQWLRRRKWWEHERISRMNFGSYCKMIKDLRWDNMELLDDPAVHGGMSDWLFSCTDIDSTWEPEVVFRLEDEFEDTAEELKLGSVIKHVNADKSGDKPKWTNAAIRLVNEAWAIEDCERFGYDLR